MSPIERAVGEGAERLRSIFGFRSKDDYQVYVGEFLRIAGAIERLEPEDVKCAVQDLIDGMEKRPLPKDIKEAVERRRDIRELRARADKIPLPEPLGAAGEVSVTMSYILDEKLRGKQWSDVRLDEGGYVTREGQKLVMMRLSKQAMSEVDMIIKRTKGRDKHEGRFEKDLAYKLRVSEGDTQHRLNEYRRLTKDLRVDRREVKSKT